VIEGETIVAERRSTDASGSGAGGAVASEATAVAPGRRDGRSRSTRERVIDVVLELLEHGGESAVRIDDVRDRSGVSIGSIYHHFGDRDGLIVAGQLRRFARYAEAEIAALSTIVERSRDLDEFRRAIRQLTLRTASEVRVAERWGRIAVLGSTVGRPALLHEIRLLQTRITDEFQAHVAQGQARGFFRSDLDARATALFVEAYTLGLALNDLDEHAVSERAWEKVIWAVLDGLFVDA
jgi:AcrR family transcriptional regulator